MPRRTAKLQEENTFLINNRGYLIIIEVEINEREGGSSSDSFPEVKNDEDKTRFPTSISQALEFQTGEGFCFKLEGGVGGVCFRFSEYFPEKY